MSRSFAVLEDSAERAAAMQAVLAGLAPFCEPRFFDNAPDMVDWLRGNLEKVAGLSLDHDLGPNRERGGQVFDPGVGRDVVDFLERQAPACPVIIHSSNSQAALGMRLALEGAGWQCRRVVPLFATDWIAGPWAETVKDLLGGG